MIEDAVTFSSLLHKQLGPPANLEEKCDKKIKLKRNMVKEHRVFKAVFPDIAKTQINKVPTVLFYCVNITLTS